MTILIRRDDVSHPAVIALLEHHVREAHANSPPNSCFPFDLSGLRDPDVTLFAAWDSDTLMGLGALREIEPGHGEIKSMRTAPEHVRKGVANVMLAHLIAEARSRGLTRISLETGTNDAYAAARALYEAAGFVESGPFGDYALTEFNRCYALTL